MCLSGSYLYILSDLELRICDLNEPSCPTLAQFLFSEIMGTMAIDDSGLLEGSGATVDDPVIVLVCISGKTQVFRYGQ